jgi:hypothetical protein
MDVRDVPGQNHPSDPASVCPVALGLVGRVAEAGQQAG